MNFARVVACLAVYCALFSGSVVDGSEVQTNIVLNGGFEDEQGERNVPARWNATRVAQLRDYWLFEWDEEIVHSGRRSASIAIGDNHPDNPIYYNWNQAPLNCRPGSSYKVEGWVKALGLKESAFIAVQCWDRGMKNVLEYANTEHKTEVLGTTDWVRVATNFIVPEDTWRVVILAGIPGHSNPGGRVWFDDIKIDRVADD